MSNDIAILVGTVSGTAAMVADELFDALEEASFTPVLKSMDEVDASIFDQHKLILVCTSTTGKGEVPDNAKKLYAELSETRPDMSAVRYGVVGFGSSHYSATFCRGPRSFDELMQALGAKKVGESCEHDAQSGNYPEEQALEWIVSWTKML
ncbi:hypothetical protein HBA55_02120 [Pseudomaricurvus alkylphenolicus]|uniref:flavodoxin domain-containing protein n=1 Tax=Pseudomaricurvus alkylphenolicus TaxID=1306991 RepID=UPI001422A841|nr:flavodoxin domain-containing protein [Pseudomaricurvus alkylphenolicus]NIB38361.1 hypothetical protein [Pseudomaricurvus alkylphenolicus]